MGILRLLVHDETYERLYNCSSYEVDDRAVELRTNRRFALVVTILGVAFMVSGRLRSPESEACRVAARQLARNLRALATAESRSESLLCPSAASFRLRELTCQRQAVASRGA